MFEDSLLIASESPLKQRGLTAFISLLLQAILVGALTVVPMLFTNALPLRGFKRIADIPAPPRLPQTETIPAVRQDHQQEISVTPAIRVPQNVPGAVIQLASPPPLTQFVTDSSAPNLTIPGGGQANSQISDLLNFSGAITPRNAGSTSKHWRVSGGVEQGLLVQEVKPVYPALARQAGVQGEVILQAVIGKDGRIENLRVISGNQVLVKAAWDAVIQWRYRPYLLDGQPVEVETQITVNFKVS